MPSKKYRDELIGVTIKDRYRIISRLGAGGMGTAYRAWDEQAGIPVVIKIPKKLFLEDPKFAERFFREIRLLQGLNHPHIVPIEGVGAHEGGLPFVVLRFLPGGSLSNRRLRNEQSKPIPGPPGMLHLWLPAIADALDFVHSQGVVHRDVKPANIFFDAFWGAFLGDFGIAKIVEESDTFDKEHTLTATHMGIGTPEYMAPEQFAPKAVIEGRADQYALAVITYEMLSGSRPFTGATAHLIVEVTTQQVPTLQATRRDLPSSLLSAVHRGLAKRPEERFASCRDFVTAVLQDVPLLADEPDVARLLCPKCSNILKLPLEAAGKRGKCPRCQTTMEVAHDLGALWLLDEARRQRKVAVSPDTSETEKSANVIWANDQTEEEALEAFKPVSNTTPIERAARSHGWKASPIAIWSGIAVALLAAVLVWQLVLGPKPPKKHREADLAVPTYEEDLAEAEVLLEADPTHRAANDLLGRHWCFRKQNWTKGLPYLAKGNAIGFAAAAAMKELEVKQTGPVSSGELLQTALLWWKVASNPTLNTQESRSAIQKHAAEIYIAAVDALTDDQDIADANQWLDRDAEFRALVSNKRPIQPKKNQVESLPPEPIIHLSFEGDWRSLDTPRGKREVKRFGSPTSIDGAYGLGIRLPLGSYLEIDLTGVMPLGNSDRTTSLWVRTHRLSQQNLAAYLCYGSTRERNQVWSICLGQDKYYFCGGWHDAGTERKPTLGAWEHLAAIKRGDSTEVWVNGLLSGTVAGPTNTQIAALLLGKSVVRGRQIEADIDEVKIWDHALSAKQVVRLYEASRLAPDPGTLSGHQASVGDTLFFTVVGSGKSGPVWGSNPYTSDSLLSRAAVHAGVLKPGESGVVRVTILPGQQSYAGSTMNGVTTSGYGPWGASYRIEKTDYDPAVMKAAEGIRAANNKQFDAATAKGDLDVAEKWQNAQEKFEKSGEVPTETNKKSAVSSAVADYKRAKELTKAYETVVKNLTMERKLAESRAARDESQVIGKNQTDVPKTKPVPVVPKQNLLLDCDVIRDAISGKWTKGAEGVQSDGSAPAKMKLPLRERLPEQYDFEVEFTPLRGDLTVTQLMSAFGTGFGCDFGGWGNTVVGFQLVDGRAGDSNRSTTRRPAWLAAGRRHVAVIQVRRNSVAAFLDGHQVVNMPTDYRNLKHRNDWSIPFDSIGIGSWATPTLFHRASVLSK